MTKNPTRQPLIINNAQVGQMLSDAYTSEKIKTIRDALYTAGTFTFPTLPNGLFPAIGQGALEGDASGYQYVWVRDTVHIAHALYRCGKRDAAVKAILALAGYFDKHKRRFETIINSQFVSRDPMTRPHVRFDGFRMEEVFQTWPHAQNDALGYFLWFCSALLRDGSIAPEPWLLELLRLFPPYFTTIEYWQDEDSGHWEEVRKISASSIGAVLAGLRELRAVIDEKNLDGAMNTAKKLLPPLIKKGKKAMDAILPSECVQRDPSKKRPFDAALLFLVFPLHIVSPEQARKIIDNSIRHLQGLYGIRRYLGDSYWAADYRDHLPPKERSADFSDSTALRDCFFKPGQEAQWCVFDPIMSIIHGERFRKLSRKEDLELQTYYLNRSLGQITPEGRGVKAFRCPEAYFLEKTLYVPNDQTPLLWAQANLLMALQDMELSIAKINTADRR
jgi:hypothetical protein